MKNMFITKLLLFLILILGLAIRYFQPSIFDFFIYWWVLILIILIGKIFHLRSLFYLTVAFISFFISGLFVSLGLKEIAESVMRISFIGWLAGLFLSSKEYNKLKKN